jgi:electron transfer flavoprotein beta subunit
MADAPPRIVVCLAPADLRPEVDPLSGEVRTDPRRADLNPSEAAALEYGLRAAEEWGSSVLALAAGPADVDPILNRAVELGAAALRVQLGPGGRPSPAAVAVEPADLAGHQAAVASALAWAIRTAGGADLVLCGDRSARSGTGAVPAFLANELGAAQALGVVSARFRAEPWTAEVERRLDGGWKERLVARLPCVVSVEAAGVRLRRAPLSGAIDASGRPISAISAPHADRSPVRVSTPRPYRPRTRVIDPPGGDTWDRLQVLTGVLSSREPPRIVGPLDTGAAADELLAYLARHGYHG